MLSIVSAIVSSVTIGELIPVGGGLTALGASLGTGKRKMFAYGSTPCLFRALSLHSKIERMEYPVTDVLRRSW